MLSLYCRIKEYTTLNFPYIVHAYVKFLLYRGNLSLMSLIVVQFFFYSLPGLTDIRAPSPLTYLFYPHNELIFKRSPPITMSLFLLMK